MPESFAVRTDPLPILVKSEVLPDPPADHGAPSIGTDQAMLVSRPIDSNNSFDYKISPKSREKIKMKSIARNGELNDAPPSVHRWTNIMLGATVAFALAFLVRIAHFQYEPITDELYHLLAAESWWNSGSLAIADGEYRRASAFTKLVGLVYGISGGSVDAVRVMCIAIGSLLVSAVYAWTARFVGKPEAWIAAALLLFMPGAIFLSQHIRFYSLHALVFFMFAGISYWLSVTQVRWQLRLAGVVAVLALATVGVHLQLTTLIGVSGLALWLAYSRRKAWIGRLSATRGNRVITAVGLLLAAAVLFAYFGTLRGLYDVYQASALWNSGDSPAYYFRFYQQQFGAFWSLAPVAIIIALFVRPLPAVFCLCIFGVAFLVHSFGGMRSERFMFYAIPFFCILWAIAGAKLLHELSEFCREKTMAAFGWTDTTGLRRTLPWVVVAASVVFLALATPATELTIKMMLGRANDSSGASEYWGRYDTDWPSAKSPLKELSAATRITIVSQPLQALYYLGDYDYALSATTLADVRSLGAVDGIDPRTGRVVFADAESLRKLLSCNESGLVIMHLPAWRNRTRVTDAVADFIVEHMDPVDVPTSWGLLVYRWTNSSVDPDCQAI